MDFLRVLMVFLSLFSERRRTQLRSQLSAERNIQYYSCFRSKDVVPPNTYRELYIHARMLTCLPRTFSVKLGERQSRPPLVKNSRKQNKNTSILEPQPKAHHRSQSQNRRYFNGLVCLVTEQTVAKGRWRTRSKRSQAGRQAGRQRGSAERPTCYLL